MKRLLIKGREKKTQWFKSKEFIIGGGLRQNGFI
jgi:hypothetical protein